MPKISIIVPIYKAEAYLHKCIDSILSQTFTDFEVLLINDGSPDRSGEICDEYASMYDNVKVIHKDNGGVSSARNTGLAHAQGEWITFIDADDWIEPFFLETFIQHPLTADTFVVQGIQYYIPQRDINKTMFKYKSDKIILPSDINKIQYYDLFENGCPVGKLFSSKIIKDHSLLFDEQLSINEDHLFVVNYYKYCSTIILRTEIGYNYYYDYKIPSLTKTGHTVAEYLHASNKLINSSESFLQYHNLSDDFFDKNWNTLGLNQLIKAAYASLNEVDTCNKIKTIVSTWHNTKQTEFYYTKRISDRLLAKLLQNKYNNAIIIHIRLTNLFRRIMLNIKQLIKQLIGF